MFIGLKGGKIFDVTSLLCNKRTDADETVKYIEVKKIEDYRIEDTWDFVNNTSLRDSPLRDVDPEKAELEQKIEDLEARIEVLETQLQAFKKTN